MQLAADVVDRFPGGVWLTDLSPIADPELVAKAVAAAAGCPEAPDSSPVEILVEYLREAEALMVVDNCEHVLDAAVDVAEALLGACPGVRILATSREPLGAAGEVTFRVPSLDLPVAEAEIDTECESVRLFADRAAQARPSLRVGPSNLTAIAAICTRLDGIPLAIELAAARCRVMTPAQIADDLKERFSLVSGGRRAGLPRHRTLEASVDWSYALLCDSERSLLRMLSVFAGGFTLDAVEECWAAADGRAAVDLVASLADKSLVQPPDDEADEPRYRLLETIRQYAAGKLIDAGEAPDARRRHAEYFAGVCETAFAGLTGPDILRLRTTMLAELDNLRAADDWATDADRTDLALRLAGREMGSPYGLIEGRQRLTRALADDDGPPAGRARALIALGEMHFFLGDVATLVTMGAEAARIAEEVGDDELRGQALGARGWALWALGDACAAESLAEGVALLRANGSNYWAADALWGLGLLAISIGDAGAAREHLDDALRLTRSVSHPLGIGRALTLLGVAVMLEGDFAPAETAFVEARPLLVECDEQFLRGVAEAGLAWIEAARGDADAALRRSEAALAEARRHHQNWSSAWLLWARATAEARGDAAPTSGAAEGEAATEAEGILWATVCCRSIRAEARLAAGHLVEARELAASAVALAEDSPYARRSLGRALLVVARCTRAEGDPAAAEDLAHRALMATAAAGARHETVEALELIAGLAVEQAAAAEAARLFAAAEAARIRLRYPRSPAEAAAVARDLTQAQADLDPETFAVARAEGSSVDLDDAVWYAGRGRGARKRPASGWAALSPTELDVARLVAAGLRNKEVAAKLFVGEATVKTHLNHVFAKLGVSNRAELAALVTRREG